LHSVVFPVDYIESEVSIIKTKVSPSNMMLTNGRSNNVDIFGRGKELHAADDFFPPNSRYGGDGRQRQEAGLLIHPRRHPDLPTRVF